VIRNDHTLALRMPGAEAVHTISFTATHWLAEEVS
jgi:hypothetical protein